MKTGRWLSFVALTLFVSACASWVELTEAGAGVMIVNPEQAAACTRVGRVTASTRDQVGGVGRHEDRVRTELRILARNEAATLGADAIVATSEPTDGRQTFDALRCAN